MSRHEHVAPAVRKAAPIVGIESLQRSNLVVRRHGAAGFLGYPLDGLGEPDRIEPDVWLLPIA